jgi:hypothetical protein
VNPFTILERGPDPRATICTRCARILCDLADILGLVTEEVLDEIGDVVPNIAGPTRLRRPLDPPRRRRVD